MGKRGTIKKTARRRRWLSPSLVLYGAMLAMLSVSVLHEAGQQLNTGRPDAGRPDAGQPDAGWPDANPRLPGRTASNAKPTSLARSRYDDGRELARRHGTPSDESKPTALLPAPSSRPAPSSTPPAFVPPIQRQIIGELRSSDGRQAVVTEPQPTDTNTRDALGTFEPRNQTDIASNSLPSATIPLPSRNPTRGSRARARQLARQAAMAAATRAPATPTTERQMPAQPVVAQPVVAQPPARTNAKIDAQRDRVGRVTITIVPVRQAPQEIVRSASPSSVERLAVPRRAARPQAKLETRAPLDVPAAPVARVVTPKQDAMPSQDQTTPPPLPSQKPGSKSPAKSSTGSKKFPTVSNAAPASTAPAVPKPDLWQPAVIEQALAQCHTILASLSAEAQALAPIKRGPCGTPAPIKLSSIGANPAVKISPPATINCAYAAALHAWVQNKLQPAALEFLGARVTKITTMASYACRKRYGRKQGKLSEHARANALDIGGFTLTGGKRINVLSTWGPTNADIARAKILARETAQAAQRQAAAAPSAKLRTGDSKQTPTAGGAAPELPQKAAARSTMPAIPTDQSRTRHRATSGPTTAGAEATGAKPGVKPRKLRGRVVQKNNRDAPAEARFLHKVHASACGVFGTVLGPEANEAHRNHFHFDLIKRRHRAYCE